MEEKSNLLEDQISDGADGSGWVTVKSRKKEELRKIKALKSKILSKIISGNFDVISSSDGYHGDDDGSGRDNGVAPSRNEDVVIGNSKSGMDKEKNKKKKKQKMVTPAEAAARIEASDLSAFLAEAMASYATQEDIQLMRFADYFGQAFSDVTAAHFPWLKLFSESKLDEIADVPFCHLPEAVYQIAADWIDKHSHEGLKSFVIWSLNSILADLASQKSLSRGTSKGAQDTYSKSKVAMFLVLSIVLRKRPDVLISLLPLLRDDSKYHGLDKLLVISWMIVQASEGDITVGFYLWAHHLLPLLGGKSGSNPKTRDLVLQVVERILTAPNARKVLSRGAVRNGERSIPPSALEQLLRVTFPAPSARVKATERFEAIYPTLIYVALYGSPRSEEVKRLSQQIQPLLLKLAGEAIPDLSEEAAKIFIWCLIQTPDCYHHWGKMYVSNLQASVLVLRRLRLGWKVLSPNVSDLSTLRDTLKGFRQKNKKVRADEGDPDHLALIKEADKYCSELLTITFKDTYCWMAIIFFCVIWMALGGAVFYFWLRETY